jgi:hypothetical protein
MIIRFLKHHHRKIQEIATGLAIFEACNFVSDFIWYPFAMTYWGVFWGGAIAFVTVSIYNTIVFVLYEYMAVDWLGAHALREIDKEENRSALVRFMTWLGRAKTTWWEKALSPIVFIILTLPIDPVIVAIHHRREHFRGISARDWWIFLAANTAANLWWILKVGLVLEAVMWVWRHAVVVFVPALFP